MRQVTALEIEAEKAAAGCDEFKAGFKLHVARNMLEAFMKMSPRMYRTKTAS